MITIIYLHLSIRFQVFLSNTNNFSNEPIWIIDGLLKVVTIPDQSRPGNNGNERGTPELEPYHQLIPYYLQKIQSAYYKPYWLWVCVCVCVCVCTCTRTRFRHEYKLMKYVPKSLIRPLIIRTWKVPSSDFILQTPNMEVRLLTQCHIRFCFRLLQICIGHRCGY